MEINNNQLLGIALWKPLFYPFFNQQTDVIYQDLQGAASPNALQSGSKYAWHEIFTEGNWITIGSFIFSILLNYCYLSLILLLLLLIFLSLLLPL